MTKGAKKSLFFFALFASLAPWRELLLSPFKARRALFEEGGDAFAVVGAAAGHFLQVGLIGQRLIEGAGQSPVHGPLGQPEGQRRPCLLYTSRCV